MKPYKYQSEVIKEISGFNGRSLVALDPGLGKTAISLWWINEKPKHTLPAIVVCPAAVKYQWEHETREVIGVRASILEGQRPSRNGEINTHPKLIIVNYDILRFWMDWLKQIRAKTIVIDEVQFCANSTLRTKSVRSLCKGVPNILGLSGTPLVNRPMELFNGLQFIRPDIFQSRWSFGQMYCDPKHTPWGWQFKGATNTDKLHDLLIKTAMTRRRKTEVLKDLPKKIRRVVLLPLRNEKEYEEASNNFLSWLQKKDPLKVYRASRAETLVKMGYLLQLAARLKLKYAVQWINTRLEESNEKMLVFAIHRKMIEALERRIKACCVVLDGRVTGRRRKSVVDQFQNDSRVKVLIGNIRAAGVGINLTAASNVVFTELPWQPGILVQAEDRSWRIGTTQEVWCWYLVAHGTIEERLCKVLQEKQQDCSAVIDGGPVSGDLDIYSRLLKSFLKGNGE